MRLYHEYFILGAAILLLVGGGYVAIGFILDQLDKKTEAMYQEIADYRWDEQRVESLSRLKQQAMIIAESESLFDATLLQVDEEVTYITYLEDVAQEVGIEMDVMATTIKQKISSGEGEEDGDSTEGGIETFDLRIDAKGSYDEVYRFLRRIETAPYIIHILSLDLNWGKETENENTRLSQGSALLSVTEGGSQEITTPIAVEPNFLLSGEMVLRVYMSEEERLEDKPSI